MVAGCGKGVLRWGGGGTGEVWSWGQDAVFGPWNGRQSRPRSVAEWAAEWAAEPGVKASKNRHPASCGEREITCLNRDYLEIYNFNVKLLSRSYKWLDTSTHGSLLEASQFVHTLEQHQGFKVACLE
jgi:hypothetical protein